MATATIEGEAISAGLVQVPGWGLWFADVTTVDPIELTPRQAVTIEFAGATLRGAILSGGEHEGHARYRVVGGAGGWARRAPAKSYRNDLGIPAADVARDLAAEVGERIDTAGLTDRVGPHFPRREELASLTLCDLAPRAWRVDLDGVTRFGARSATPYTPPEGASLVRHDPALGVREYDVIELGALLPGISIDGETVADIEYHISPEGVRVVAYSSETPRSRALDAIGDIVRALFPRLAFLGKYEFRVIQQVADRLDLQPVRSTTGFSELRAVQTRPGCAGIKATCTPGALVLVEFVDGDRARPVVTNFDAPDNPGFRPVDITIDAPSIALSLGTAPIPRDDHLQSALSTLATAVQSGIQAVGESAAASGSAGALAFQGALGAWPPPTASESGVID